MTDWPAEVRRLRKLLGISQARLAWRLGVTCSTVNRWENKAAVPSKLARLALKALEETAK